MAYGNNIVPARVQAGKRTSFAYREIPTGSGPSSLASPAIIVLPALTSSALVAMPRRIGPPPQSTVHVGSPPPQRTYVVHRRVADVARAALTERAGSSTKGRTPNCFVAKLSIVAIYALFERLSQGFERKSSCFRRAFNESHLAFVELSTKDILLS